MQSSHPFTWSSFQDGWSVIYDADELHVAEEQVALDSQTVLDSDVQLADFLSHFSVSRVLDATILHV